MVHKHKLVVLGLAGLLLTGCGVIPSAMGLSDNVKLESKETTEEVKEVEVAKDYLLVIKGGKVVDEKVSKSIVKDGEISNTYKYIYELPEELTTENLVGEVVEDSEVASDVAYETAVDKSNKRYKENQAEDPDVWITFTVPSGYQVYLIPNVLEAQYSSIKNELLAQTTKLTEVETSTTNEVEGPVTSTVKDFE